MSNELLTVPEAAAALRLKPSTVRAWLLRRKLPFCKLGRLVRIRRVDVEELIAQSVVPAAEIGRVSLSGLPSLSK